MVKNTLTEIITNQLKQKCQPDIQKELQQQSANMPLLGKENIPLEGINNSQIDITAHNSDYLFKNYWTAKEFIAPGKGLENVGGEGWVGGVSQVKEIGNYPLTQPWEQTSLLDSLLRNKLLKEKTVLPPAILRSGKVPGTEAIFYPKELPDDYGAWMTQIYVKGKGIAAFTDLGNNTYAAQHYYSPQNLSTEKSGSTLQGLKEKKLIKS
jgi:hypothetical protein